MQNADLNFRVLRPRARQTGLVHVSKEPTMIILWILYTKVHVNIAW